jgi:hypothetical protein
MCLTRPVAFLSVKETLTRNIEDTEPKLMQALESGTNLKVVLPVESEVQ